MPLQAACPKCKKQYQLPDQLAGKSVKCKACGNSFAVGAPAAPPALAAASKAPRPGANVAATGELAKLGIDGPIVRTSTDIFADAPQPPRQGDPLGNFAAEDPGFGGAGNDKSKSKSNSKSKGAVPPSPPKSHGGHGGHGADEKPSALPFDNPHAAAAATFAKQPKMKASELQKEFDRLDKAGNNLRSMMLGFLASIPIAPAIMGLLYVIIWANDYAVNFSKEQLGLSPELFYTAIGMTAFAAIMFLTTYFVFANGAVRLAGNLKPDSKSWILHLILCVTLVGGIITFIMLNISARDQLKKAGFKLGLLGVTRSPDAK